MEFAVYKHSGIFLCLLGISYLLVCLRMYLVGDPVVYQGYIVFLVAAIAFAKLSISIYGIVMSRHRKSPVITTLKIINFTDAMVSIVVTQFTLLTMQRSPHAMESSALFGMGCSLFFIILGILMRLKRKQLD